MNRIIQILIKNHVFFLFIILQLIAVQLLINNHFVIESKFLSQVSNIKSKLYLKEKNLKKYFELKSINNKLLQINDSLLKSNINLQRKLFLFHTDTLMFDSIVTVQANVLRNSWNKRQNYITINSGKKHNIHPKMGVINNNGLVGITHNVSGDFSTIISLINTNLTVSAKIKNSGKFGTLNWDGENPKIMQLTGLPKNVNIEVGDTVVTSSYSNILPADIHIGTVSSYKSENNTNFLTISVNLLVDFTNLNFVHIIKNPLKKERKLIENEY
ncbi:MAG: rod shape-determining protein MreC [Flavobacteriales bacterium]|nr:rod shape-determining protein MreC [Flavobacteriales bacterium]|tara:strand:+ start:23148 stop:23960 length:813 start_codon:yes stop_codon:yes gene_type:complete